MGIESKKKVLQFLFKIEYFKNSKSSTQIDGKDKNKNVTSWFFFFHYLTFNIGDLKIFVQSTTHTILKYYYKSMVFIFCVKIYFMKMLISQPTANRIKKKVLKMYSFLNMSVSLL